MSGSSREELRSGKQLLLLPRRFRREDQLWCLYPKLFIDLPLEWRAQKQVLGFQ
jgi:hypothetical protein